MTESDTEGTTTMSQEKTPEPRRARSPRRREPDAVDRLAGTFSALSRGWALIGIATLLSVGIGLIATLAATKEYEATALVRVFEGPAGDVSGDPASVQDATQTEAQTYAATLNSKSFISRIAPNVGDGGTSATSLNARVSAAAIPDTALISVTVTDDSETGASELATQVVDAFRGAIREDGVAANREQQNVITRQIEDIDTTLAEREDFALQTARTQLVSQLSDVIAARSSAGTNLALAAPPDASGGQVSPRPVFNLLVALLVGLIIGGLLTWIGRRMNYSRGAS